MTRVDDRKMTVKLVERDEVLNLRILAETIADKIRKGEIKL